MIALVLVGTVFGKLVDALLPPDTFHIPGHQFLAVVIVALVTVGAVFGIRADGCGSG